MFHKHFKLMQIFCLHLLILMYDQVQRLLFELPKKTFKKWIGGGVEIDFYVKIENPRKKKFHKPSDFFVF